MSAREYAVITGASSGIGAATARLLASNGYHVIAAARRADRLAALAAEDQNIEAFTLDVTKQDSVDSLTKHLQGKPVSILINCAGGAFDAAAINDSDPEIWKKTFDINVVGSVRMVKAMTPLMQAFGHGHIVMISSTAGHRVYENGGSYVAAKFAETSLVETLRLELNGQPIRVTEIAPGMVKTDEFAVQRFGGDTEKAAKVYEGVTRPLVAEDVAEAIRWSVMLPSHFNVDSLVIRPLAQAQSHKVYRQPL
ncbi:SDR family mycofactocin-dependent oxidoreductase [Candidatus Planktophila versatilis]|uniref:SDR family mycofactocin-dependent oxidoreductase n=1 Tax=Candidatus Planktophila versatilis TaxID=1884905 RepID=A0AAC9YXC8_9ACTN|nr:SDR family oxidoreductase [Candidatus Planktophila versatilis]ASY22280.1 SDR family mycofactocin-dependent oxidoreductase [Candidatus Planktophila versatilis]